VTARLVVGGLHAGESRRDDTGNGIGEGNGPDRQSHDHGTYLSYAGASYRNHTNSKFVSYGGVVSGRSYYRSWVSGLRWCR
jgi:hypothetical protein